MFVLIFSNPVWNPLNYDSDKGFPYFPGREDTNRVLLPEENFLKLSTDFRFSATFLVENPGTIS